MSLGYVKQINFDRVLTAARRRIEDVEHRVAWAFSTEGARNIAENAEFRKPLQKGSRCILICNGPSLNQTDMSLLKNEVTFGMNRSYLMYDEWGFVPTYFVAIAKHVLEQFSEDIVKLPMPKFVDFKYRKQYPLDAGCHYLRLPPTISNRFIGDICQPITGGGTVTYSTLQIAYHMGFETVIIVGMDHRFSASGMPATTEVRTDSHDKDHMHPNYFPKGVKWELPDLDRAEAAYSNAKKAFEQRGAQIIDCTVNGACQIFPKMRLEDVLNAK